MTVVDITNSTDNSYYVPEEFYKLVDDFTSDISNAFPEYMGVILKWWNREKHDIDAELKKQETIFLYKHCLRIYPERVADILSKNDAIFSFDSVVSTEFLPGIVFKMIWYQKPPISENNKETIWKYIQLIFVSVIGNENEKKKKSLEVGLGDTSSIFDNINEEELKEQLQLTLENITSLFENNKNNEADADCFNNNIESTDTQLINNDDNDNNGINDINGINVELPNIDNIQDQLKGLMDGKLGQLAMEMAKDTANTLTEDLDGSENPANILQNMFSKPGMMMDMVKNIGSKLDEKIKTGDIKENELMQEGMNLMTNMKNVPGFDSLFSQLSGCIGQQTNNTRQQNNNNGRGRGRGRGIGRSGRGSNSIDKYSQHTSATPPLPNISDEELFKIFDSVDKKCSTNNKTK
jgi:hypothetical protein